MLLSGRLPPGEMYPAGVPGVTSRFVQVSSGLRVRVVESGSEGAPPVVLVPGWACNAWIYRETLPALSTAGFRPMVVELKGHGLSDKPSDPAEYTLDAMRDHLIDILDALEVPRCALVGHSMGASVAAHAAAAAPQRVSGVALVAPVGFAGVPGMGLCRALTPDFLVDFLPYIASRTVVRLMLELVYGDLTQPTVRDVDELRAPSQFPDFTKALRNLLHRFDRNVPLPRLNVPRLVIAGTKDHLSPASEAAAYSGEREPVIVEGAGHVLFAEAPEIVNRALIDFFRSWGD